MPRGISNKRKVSEAAASLRRLIINADSKVLQLFAKGRSLGVRINSDGSTSVCFTRGSMRNPRDDIDNVEVYLEPPLHELSVSDPCMPFSLEICKEWLCSRGIDCNISELAAKHSGAALERQVARKLFSHPGVCFLYKMELLQEVSEVMQYYSDDLACRIGLRSYSAKESPRVAAP